jgi:hypothetical protein
MKITYQQLDDVIRELQEMRSDFRRENHDLISKDGDDSNFQSELQTEEINFWRRQVNELLDKSAPEEVTTAFAEGFGDMLERLYDRL